MNSAKLKITVISLFFLLATFPKVVYANVVINEVFPKTDDITQEWIELYNNGSDAQSLDRWRVENTSGDIKSYMMNASVLLQGKSFLVLKQTDTGISLNKNGDTVQLFDEKNNKVDAESYLGILGYNTSMGRTSDGSGVWATCTIQTPNAPNSCPAPTSTPIVPTALPTATPIPTPTTPPTPLPTVPLPTVAVLAVTTSILPTSPPAGGSTPTPLLPTVSPEMQQKQRSVLGIAAILIALIWIAFLSVFFIRKRMKMKS